MEQSIVIRQDELSVADVIAQTKKIQEIMKEVMKDGEHYGVIPGTKKPTLLKAGAEKLCLTFRLDPQYESSDMTDGNHLTVKSKCTLYHIPTSMRLGSGEGSCSTKESKYAYRDSKRICPKCQKETIIKGKEEYGGGWLCFAKVGGCGAKFSADDQGIIGQVTGMIPNEHIADQYNTILKMANKRSLVAAVLNVTAASDLFTQDLEDLNRKVVRQDEVDPRDNRGPMNYEPDPREVVHAGETVNTQTGEIAPILKPSEKFNPETEDAGSQKYPGKMWSEIPSGYLGWTTKNSKNAKLRKKAEATLAWLKNKEASEPPPPDVLNEMLGPVEASFDVLAETLNVVAKEHSVEALTKWLKDAEPKMVNLKAPEKIVLHKAWKNAMDDAKKVAA